jgi:peptidoglycan/LPS O-acetylase OafA/YrhL
MIQTGARTRSGVESTHRVRKDIQGLRALAVVAVVVYHVWPRALPGGFVGVDVFFVISGFLITGQLLAAPPGRPASFVRFWGRRVLRLIPAAVVVIGFTLLGALLFMPSSEWQRVAREAVSSMFYVENWRLIADSTNYLDQHQSPSVFQHFWSLSVEEQYYLLWPFVVAALAWLSRRWTSARRRLTFALGFGVVVVTSLVLSITLTAANPSLAYFSTFTRLWELGIGSLLAVLAPAILTTIPARLRMAVWLVGVLGLGVALVVIDDKTPFPGAAALLPTLAAAAVIAADDPQHRLNPRRLYYAGPVQHLGDTSYALYLWHWPLITMAPFVLDRKPGVVADL